MQVAYKNPKTKIMMNQIKVKHIICIMVGMVLWCTSGVRSVFADETHMWPVVTDVKTSSDGRTATVVWATIPVTLSDAELDTVACTLTTNVASCDLLAFSRVDKDLHPSLTQDGTEFVYIASVLGQSSSATRGHTWREIFSEYQFTAGSKTSTLLSGWYRSSCFRIGLISSNISGSGAWPTSHPWANIHNETSVPPGISPVNSSECIGTPPADEWCAPETINLDFDFGAVKTSSASGTQRSKDITVRCTTDMKFKLFLQQQNATSGSISLNNGMEGMLSINGEALSDSIQQGTDGTVNIPLTVTLTGEPESEGTFTGSGVVGISYP